MSEWLKDKQINWGTSLHTTAILRTSIYIRQNSNGQFNIEGLAQVGFVQSISGSGFEAGLESRNAVYFAG